MQPIAIPSSLRHRSPQIENTPPTAAKPDPQPALNPDIFQEMPTDLFLKIMQQASVDRWEEDTRLIQQKDRGLYVPLNTSKEEQKKLYGQKYGPLHLALDYNPDLSQKTANGSSVLIEAMWHNNKGLFDYCLKLPRLEKGIMKQTDPGGLSVLTMAIVSRHSDAIPELIRHGAKATPTDMMYAAWYGRPEIIENDLWPNLEEQLAHSKKHRTRVEHRDFKQNIISDFGRLISEDENLKPWVRRFELDDPSSTQDKFAKIKAKLMEDAKDQKQAIAFFKDRPRDERWAFIKAAANSGQPVSNLRITSLIASHPKNDLYSSLVNPSVKNGHNNIVRLLLANKSLLPYTAGESLKVACTQRNVELLKMLLRYGANPDSRTYKPILHMAVETDEQNLVKALLDYKANIDITDPAGNTALHHAVKAGGKEMVAFLLKQGANANIRNKDGMNVLDLSTDREMTRLIRQNLTWSQIIANPLIRSKKAVTQWTSKQAKSALQPIIKIILPNIMRWRFSRNAEQYFPLERNRFLGPTHLMLQTDPFLMRVPPRTYREKALAFLREIWPLNYIISPQPTYMEQAFNQSFRVRPRPSGPGPSARDWRAAIGTARRPPRGGRVPSLASEVI